MSGGKIAYVLKGFPRLSETFIANEVHLLSEMGLSLELFSIKRGDDLAFGGGLPDVNYLPAVSPASSSTLPGWLRHNYPVFADCQRYWLRTGPLRYLRCLVFALWAALRYRSRTRTVLNNSIIKQFFLATYIAEKIAGDSSYVHIHAHFCHDATMVAWMVSRLTGLPFSFTAHAKDIYQKTLNPGDLLERKLAATSFAVTCTNTNVEYLRARTSSPEKIYGIYHGLDTDQFAPPAGASPVAKLCPPPRKLLTIGRQVEKKGFIYLIEACRILRERDVPFQLDIVGAPGDHSESISKAIVDYQLQDHIAMRPPMRQQDLLALYQEASVFVLPCIVLEDGDRDGIPNVIAEAMACALPVVVTGVSGIPELVNDKVNGMVVPDRNAHQIADAIEHLLGSPETCKQLGGAARKRVEDIFDSRDTHLKLRNLFNHALANTAPRL